MSGLSSGASVFNCCSRWCRRRPNGGSSNREQCESSGDPKKANGGVSWVAPSLNDPADEAEYRRVFAALAQDGAGAIVVGDEEENMANLKLIVDLAEKIRLPAIYLFKMFVQAGGLMSYGIDDAAIGRRIADMADEILKGAKPSEIPIFQPTKFELVINLKTAKALGLTVPADAACDR